MGERRVDWWRLTDLEALICVQIGAVAIGLPALVGYGVIAALIGSVIGGLCGVAMWLLVSSEPTDLEETNDA